MKKILGITMLSLLISLTFLQAQVCMGVSAEVIPMSPQAPPNNYFGIRVWMSQTYGENVTVSGYIHDVNNQNEDHPFTLTITTDNSSAETEADFYETGYGVNAVVVISNVAPCPYSFPIESVFSNIGNTSVLASLINEEDSLGLCEYFLPTAIQIDNYIQWKYGFDMYENYDTSNAIATMITGLLYFGKEKGYNILENGNWEDPLSEIEPMECFVTVLSDLIGLTTINALYNTIVNGGSAKDVKSFLRGAVRRVFAIIAIGIAIYDLGHDCLGWWKP